MMIGCWFFSAWSSPAAEEDADSWRRFADQFIPVLSAVDRASIKEQQRKVFYLLRNEPANLEARLRAGAMAFAQGSYDEAADLYRGVLLETGFHRQASLRYVQSLYLSGDGETAEFVIDFLREQGHVLSLNELIAAEIAFHDRRPRDAVNLLTVVLAEIQRVPADQRSASQVKLNHLVLHNLALALRAAGDTARAERIRKRIE